MPSLRRSACSMCHTIFIVLEDVYKHLAPWDHFAGLSLAWRRKSLLVPLLYTPWLHAVLHWVLWYWHDCSSLPGLQLVWVLLDVLLPREHLLFTAILPLSFTRDRNHARMTPLPIPRGFACMHLPVQPGLYSTLLRLPSFYLCRLLAMPVLPSLGRVTILCCVFVGLCGCPLGALFFPVY